MLGTSANRSASPQICKLRAQGLGLRICKQISYRKHLRISGKKIDIYCKSTNQQHHWDRFCNFRKNTFLRFNVSTGLGGCILKYNTLSPTSSAVERLLSRGAAILTAKWVDLRSRNFQRLVFVKENLDFLKWQRVAQNDFDDMSSTFSK